MKERQTTFGGGVFSPSLWGRTDYQRYASGARELLNFFVEPHGAASNRPGTIHIARTKADGAAVFVPFVFSEGDAILLVFTHLALRFYRLPSDYGTGTTAVNWSLQDAGGTDLELTTPYDEDDDLTKLRVAQIGNIMRVMHPSYPPYELQRIAADGTQWLFAELSFAVAPFPDYGGEPRLNHSPYKVYNDTSLVFATTVQPQSLLGDAQHLPDAWVWKVTRVMKDSHGRLYETLPFTVRSSVARGYFEFSENSAYNVGDTVIVPELPGKIFSFLHAVGYHAGEIPRPANPPDAAWWAIDTVSSIPAYLQDYLEVVSPLPPKVALATDWAQVVTWRTSWNNLIPDIFGRGAGDDEIVATRIYRGLAGFYGFMGQVNAQTIVANGDSFTDIGVQPVFEDPPPSGQNPLEVFDELGVLVRTENPSLGAFFQGRFLMAATAERPNLTIGSAVEDYENFDKVDPPDDADSYSFELASRRLEAIKAIIPGRVLVLMTTSSVWEVTGSEGELVTPLSIAARPVSGHGCSDLEPIEAQSTVLFVQRAGGLPLAMVFSTEGGGYQAIDIAEASAHFFIGHSIVSWAYAENPYKLLYAVRDDGVLLISTYDPRQEMRAWTQHELGGGGLAEWVAVLPEGTEHGVYLLVNRDGVRSIERFATRVLTDVRDAVFLDSAAVYRGKQTTEGLGYDFVITNGIQGGATGTNFTVQFDASEAGMASKVGMVVQIDAPGGGLPFRFQFTVRGPGAGEYTAVVLESRAFIGLWGEEGTESLFDEGTDGTVSFLGSDYWICLDTITGLDHLEGQDVIALADGNVVGPLAVVGGAVGLGDYAAIAAVGLAYVSDLISLPIVADKAKPKLVASVTVETVGSRAGYVGDAPRPDEELDTDDMTEMRDRDIEHGYGPVPLRRLDVEHTVASEWKELGAVAVRQVDPLPLTIVGITRDVEIGKP